MACATIIPSESLNQKLIAAAEIGDTPLIIDLIRRGANINAINSEGWTPYLAAAAAGQLETMKLLKMAGARQDPGF
jgi:ankyrin repeat protein